MIQRLPKSSPVDGLYIHEQTLNEDHKATTHQEIDQNVNQQT